MRGKDERLRRGNGVSSSGIKDGLVNISQTGSDRGTMRCPVENGDNRY